LNARQLAELEAFYALEPFGELREDMRNAMLCRLLATIHSDPKKGTKFTLEDFMFNWDYMFEEEDGQSPDEMKSIMMGFSKKDEKRNWREEDANIGSKRR